MPVNTGYISDGTTNLSNLSLNGQNSANLVASDISGARMVVSTVTVGGLGASIITATSRITTPILQVSGGLTASAGSLDLRTNTVVISIDTRANASGMTTGQLRLVFQASGVSLMYSSGATSYTVGASAVSAAQA